MDDIEKFVTGLNIARFLDSLTTEQDRTQRRLWIRLLIAEMDRFGTSFERQTLVSHCLESCSGRIAAQRARLEKLAPDGPYRDLEELFLANLLEVEHSIRIRRDQLAQRAGPDTSNRGMAV